MPLTPEIIATTWSSGGTVQIATPADLNVFNEYVSIHPTAETIRNAEITADLDFEDGDITFVQANPQTQYGQITNLVIDGKGHTIKRIIEDALNVNSIFFNGYHRNTDNTVIKDLTFYKCNITWSGSNVLSSGTIRNVKLDHCRFTTTNASGYTGLIANDIQNYSSAVTVHCNNGGDYHGVEVAVESKRIALLDTVYRNTTGGTAIALYYAQGVHSLAFTRNRFHNFATVTGIHRFYMCQVSTTYAAITAENATEIYPLGGTFNTYPPIASYFDNVLVPNAAAYTDLGLTTSELQSVATMTAKGFAVEEA